MDYISDNFALKFQISYRWILSRYVPKHAGCFQTIVRPYDCVHFQIYIGIHINYLKIRLFNWCCHMLAKTEQGLWDDISILTQLFFHSSHLWTFHSLPCKKKSRMNLNLLKSAPTHTYAKKPSRQPEDELRQWGSEIASFQDEEGHQMNGSVISCHGLAWFGSRLWNWYCIYYYIYFFFWYTHMLGPASTVSLY